MRAIRNLLSIAIITYNRSAKLEQTIKSLLKSPLRECTITILNNASTDGTEKILSTYSGIKNIIIVNNKYNIGLGANYLKAYEYIDTPYSWIIADDDTYDFSKIEDVVSAMDKEAVELIHIGAHTDKPWSFGGKYIKVHDAVDQGYSYFKYSSFIGCNIIKTNSFKDSIIEAYENIVNCYPHMPFLLSLYVKNQLVYISENRIAKATPTGQSYSYYKLYGWWSGTCNLLKSKQDRRKCFFDQFNANPVKLMLNVWYLNKYDYLSTETMNNIKSYLIYSELIAYELLKIPYILLKRCYNNRKL